MTIPHFSNFINGSFQHEQGNSLKISITNPATNKIIATVSRGSAKDMENAIINGKNTFKSGVWSKLEPQSRSRIMLKIADNLKTVLPEWAELESLQTGRPKREMKIQLSRLPEWIEYFAAVCRTAGGETTPFKGSCLNYIQRVPLGVVAQITPWNHPLLIAIKKIAPALAAGNCIVVKPSELAPINVLKFALLCKESGLPDGVLNVVCGYGNEAGVALSTSPHVSKMDFTGGTETGRIIARAAGQNLISCTTELGGKAPVIVFNDADLQAAVNGAAFASFIASGQTCVAGSRILLQKDVAPLFLEKLVEKVSKIQMGDPMNTDTQLGPLINKEAVERCTRFVERALQQGANLLYGGYKPPKNTLPQVCQEGYYFHPTLLTNVTPEMDIFQQEVFGPVVAITTFETVQEALNLANNSDFGLAASVWTRDISLAHSFVQDLDVGLVWINAHHLNDPSSPWGGTKLTGMGRENGMEAYRSYTEVKSVVVNYGQPSDWFGDVSARYG